MKRLTGLRRADDRAEGRDESGQIFVLVLAMLVVLGILAGTLAGLASPSLTHAQVVKKVNDMVATADAGIEYGVQSLKTAPTQCLNPLPQAPTINNQAPVVSCTPLGLPNDGLSYVLLVSTAQIGSGSANTVDSRAVLEINDQTGSLTIVSWRTCRNAEC